MTPTARPPRSVPSAAAGLLGLGAIFALAGCMTQTVIAPRPAAEGSLAVREEATTSSRPSVKVSAADLYSWGPGASAQQLEFYDEVETREVVAHDDVLHAALLFGRGASAPTFAQRMALAKQEGWIDRTFSRPGREAATVGEVSQIMARVMGLGGSSSPEAATDALSQIGVLPAQTRAEQGITGRQFLALLGSSYDWLQNDQSAPRPLAVRPKVIDLDAQAGAQPGTPETAPVTAAPVAAAPAPTAPAAMPEPLPEVPVARSMPAPAAPPPQPAAEPDPVAAPAPAAPQPTPRPWVGGRPLNKKKS